MLTVIPVYSNEIRSIGYDNDTCELQVNYIDDTRSLFSEVQMEIFMELFYSNTKSEFLEQHIFEKYEKVAG